MIFQCVDPTVLGIDVMQLVECAAECKTEIHMLNACVWRYMNNGEWQYRVFHSQKCALECMLPALLNNA